MKLLVLDPRNGDRCADLFLLDPLRRTRDQLRLGYVPELHLDPAASELVLVETALRSSPAEPTRYWLKRLAVDTLELRGQVEVPPRPMYAGFPGRSTRVVPDRAGRFIYVLENLGHPQRQDVYRTHVHRYNRRTGRVESGCPAIDSCMIAFGPLGDDGELFFHLSCEFPSTVAFAHFDRPELQLLTLEEVPYRTSHGKETCGSWFDSAAQVLYCVTGEGSIFRVQRGPARKELLARLPLVPPCCVPLHALHGGGGRLFVGVSTSSEERSLGLMSEVWPLSLAQQAMGPPFALPFPVLNFVVDAAGEVLFGVNPYLRRLLVATTSSGRLLDRIDNLGVTPAEVQLIAS